jgi:tetratricopeptide (TPR) repeat protein
MNRPGKDKVSFTDGGNVTQEAMLAYLNNRMSAEDKQQFEKLLAEDPFAQDALEGLQSARNAESLLNTIQGIKKNIREKSGVREKKVISINIIQYAAAAVIFGLLIGVGFIMFYFMGNKNDSMAENTKATTEEVDLLKQQELKPANESVIVADSEAIVNGFAGSDSVAFSFKSDEALVNKQTQGAVSVEDIKAINKGTYTLTATDASPGKEESAKKPVFAPVSPGTAANQTVIANGNGTAPSTYNWTTDDADKKDVERRKVTKESEKNLEEVQTVAIEGKKKAPALAQKTEAANEQTEVVSIDNARTKFNAGDYKTSGEQFDQVLKTDPNNADALYFGGVSDYIQGKTNKSEKNFDKLLKQGTKYVDGAKWYKANILLKKGKTAEAKALLNDLANSNNSYKERAVKKIEEIKQ